MKKLFLTLNLLVASLAFASNDVTLHNLARNGVYQANKHFVETVFEDYQLDKTKTYMVLSLKRNKDIMCSTSVNDLLGTDGLDFDDDRQASDQTMLIAVSNTSGGIVVTDCGRSTNSYLGTNPSETINQTAVSEYVKAVLINFNNGVVLPGKGTRLVVMKPGIMNIIHLKP